MRATTVSTVLTENTHTNVLTKSNVADRAAGRSLAMKAIMASMLSLRWPMTLFERCEASIR